jgi:phosphatidylglycerol:prolipoprotein diacylglycerol transferase
MRRILFRWRGLTVWSYPAFLWAGLVTAVVTGNVAAHAARIDAFRTLIAMHLLIVPALLGARLLYVASSWRRHRADRRRIFSRQQGGAAMYGALPVMLALSLPLLAALDLPFGAFWDVAGIAILAGMIVTRVGCLLNGCCAGRPSPAGLGLHLPDDAGVWERRVPTQLLEAGWAAVLLVGAVSIWRRLPFPGALFLCVAAGYASGRLALESFRQRRPGTGRLTLHHAISFALVVSSLATLASRWSD